MKALKLRFKILYSVFGVICLILIARLYVLSIARHDYYEKIARDNAFKTEVLVPVRGQILDRNNEPLAINELGFELALKTKLKKDQLDSALNLIASVITNANIEALKQKYLSLNSVYRRKPIVLIDFIPYSQGQIVYSSLIQDPNISLVTVNKRLYPNNSMASHVIGYVGASDEKDVLKDPISKYTKIIGKLGLEKEYNTFLQGKLGHKEIQVNNLNQQLKVLSETPATSNNHITTSLDVRLQSEMDNQFKGKNGAAIVMDARNGEILASGSYPEYNINDFVGGISHKKYNALKDNIYDPLINRLVGGLYPPGSVVKMGMGLAILEYAGVNEHTLIDTPYYIEVGGHKFRDWKIGGHGKTDLVKALKESVDVYFYKLSQIAGINNIAHVMRTLGFGEKTGVDLPYENKGVFPDPEWKMKSYHQVWYAGDTIITSIGQGSTLVTPMQIARYTALMATGLLPTPHYAKDLGSTPVIKPPKDVLNAFEKSKLPYIRKGMYEVCSVPGGTAYRHTRGTKVPLACKTGTAQVVSIPQDVIKRRKESEMNYFQRSQGWVTAFLPYNNPKYVVTILVEHAGTPAAALPILVDLANKLDDLGYIKDKNTK
ncbi:penicillin-binding protein 2 [Helicobacter sp. 13S00401-1]|uniref:penicillin-binding protein 2 n=1 Tax=Helicobacter sp. 13S00401-1 TaxID=1905758 RepID=UPI000BA506DC|nr:penicillin-binding protein 2 [Helicobacter sp. 13S00401-1]PAF51665.1 penicillin-binding protein 2 [Helicobacter sp. 13S00401-1]